VVRPWLRATPAGAKVAAGYMTIVNQDSLADRLIGGSASIGKFEIHEMSMEGGVMKMRPLRNGLEIKAGAATELKPGSFHVMFQNLNRPLVKGERIKGTLVFERRGSVDVEYEVIGLGEVPAGAAARPRH
jgi:copper(I)-binding protein